MKDLTYVRECVEDDGIYTTIMDYSDFEDVEDEHFHELRLNMINSIKELADYLRVRL